MRSSWLLRVWTILRPRGCLEDFRSPDLLWPRDWSSVAFLLVAVGIVPAILSCPVICLSATIGLAVPILIDIVGDFFFFLPSILVYRLFGYGGRFWLCDQFGSRNPVVVTTILGVAIWFLPKINFGVAILLCLVTHFGVVIFPIPRGSLFPRLRLWTFWVPSSRWC